VRGSLVLHLLAIPLAGVVLVCPFLSGRFRLLRLAYVVEHVIATLAHLRHVGRAFALRTTGQITFVVGLLDADTHAGSGAPKCLLRTSISICVIVIVTLASFLRFQWAAALLTHVHAPKIGRRRASGHV